MAWRVKGGGWALAILVYFNVAGVCFAGDTGVLDTAWRARLVTLPPACGLKDAEWAATARQTIAAAILAKLPTAKTRSGYKYVPQLSIDRMRAALAMGEALARGARLI